MLALHTLHTMHSHAYPTILLLLLFLLPLLHHTAASPFNPLPLTKPSRFLPRPWFDGWFFRVTDHEKRISATAIIGALQQSDSDRAHYSTTWSAMMLRRADGQMDTRQVFTPTVTLQWPTPPSRDHASPSRFALRSPDLGTFTVNGDAAHLRVDYEGMQFEAVIKAGDGPRRAWDMADPDGDGPEGWVGRYLPSFLLPCHYFIHTLGSKVSYTVAVDGGEVVTGTGVAHLETNYGQMFPSSWVWAQSHDR